MNQIYIIAPLLWQMLIAIALIFCWRVPQLHRRVSIAGSVLGMVPAVALLYTVWHQGTLTLAAGNWAAPFGIVLVADTLSATMVLLTAVSGLAVSLFSTRHLLGNRLNFGYFPVFHFLLMGLTGAFLAGDVFNMYVWFEIMIISSFVLLSLGGLKQQLEGAVKYFTLNMLASIIFLTAVALLYGLTGSLNMADLAGRMAAVENKTLVRITGIVFFVGFGIKAAIFPLYFWLPASYHTPPAPVSAIFGGLLTKVGVYAMVRMFTLVFPPDPYLNNLFISVAIITIVLGGLGAAIQVNIQRIFSYLIICHIGYMVLGLGLGNQVALTGLVFYMIHDIVVKTNLFLTGGMVQQLTGSYDVHKAGGLYGTYPWLSLLMAVPLFSLVGIPPLSGFWPKLSLINGAIEAGSYWGIGAIVLGSFLTLYVIARLWAEVYWKKAPAGTPGRGLSLFDKLGYHDKLSLVLPLILLAMASLYVGLGAPHLQVLAERIGAELANPRPYIDAVLHGSNAGGKP